MEITRQTFVSDDYQPDVSPPSIGPAPNRPDGGPEFKAPRPCNPRTTILTLPAMEQSDLRAALHDACATYIEQLRQTEPRAAIAVVAYEARAQVRLAQTSVMQPRLMEAVSGETEAGEAGYGLALSVAETAAHGVTWPFHVIFVANGRDTFDDSIEPYAVALRRHAFIDCVGIGHDPEEVDEAQLRRIASQSNGKSRYRWLGANRDEIVRYFRHLAGRHTWG